MGRSLFWKPKTRRALVHSLRNEKKIQKMYNKEAFTWPTKDPNYFDEWITDSIRLVKPDVRWELIHTGRFDYGDIAFWAVSVNRDDKFGGDINARKAGKLFAKVIRATGGRPEEYITSGG